MSYVIFRAYFLVFKILLHGAETSGIVMASGNALIHGNNEHAATTFRPQIFRVLEINKR